jgi:hypothetical protein
MNEEVNAILSRLPADKKINVAVCEALDKIIREGGEINQLQRDTIFNVVKSCVEHNTSPPALLESFCAYAYTEWTEEAKTSEEEKKNLAGLVKLLKASPPVATSVAKLAHDVVQKREARRQQLKRLAEAMINSAGATVSGKRDRAASDPPKVYVRKMQQARLGVGGQQMPNINLAVQLAEEAIDAYPNTPLVLFEAAGCYQLHAEKSTHLSPTERYVSLRQAHTLYQRCYDCLTTQPYANLKGEYDKWRSGTAALLVKIHKELESLGEKQK